MADLATGNLGLFMKTSGLHWWGPEVTAVEGHVNFDKEQLAVQLACAWETGWSSECAVCLAGLRKAVAARISASGAYIAVY